MISIVRIILLSFIASVLIAEEFNNKAIQYFNFLYPITVWIQIFPSAQSFVRVEVALSL
jgi:predicted permease